MVDGGRVSDVLYDFQLYKKESRIIPEGKALAEESESGSSNATAEFVSKAPVKELYPPMNWHEAVNKCKINGGRLPR